PKRKNVATILIQKLNYKLPPHQIFDSPDNFKFYFQDVGEGMVDPVDISNVCFVTDETYKNKLEEKVKKTETPIKTVTKTESPKILKSLGIEKHFKQRGRYYPVSQYDCKLILNESEMEKIHKKIDNLKLDSVNGLY